MTSLYRKLHKLIKHFSSVKNVLEICESFYKDGMDQIQPYSDIIQMHSVVFKAVICGKYKNLNKIIKI